MPAGDAHSGGQTDVLRVPEQIASQGGHRAAVVAGFCGWLLDAGYRWFATHRRCSRQGCELEARSQNVE